MSYNEGKAQTTEEVFPTAKPEQRRYNLDARLEKEICALAKKHGLKKVILFGSRARGTNYERSDVDLAVSGGDTLNFSFDVDEEWFEENCDLVFSEDDVNIYRPRSL